MNLALPFIGFLVLVGAWNIYVTVWHVSSAVLPSPVTVWDALIENHQLIVREGWITLVESVLGFLLAFVLGIPIALLISSSRLMSLTFYPLLICAQSLPKVALAPLLLVWLGFGIESKLAIAWLVAFFPIVVDTATGLRSTPSEFLDLAASLRASRLQVFFKIKLPAALPFILSGSKVAITLAVVGAVIGEFVGSAGGLGNVLLTANSQLNTPLAFAALIGLSVLGIGLYLAVVITEVLLRPWLGEAAH
jgi:NitT/TauT family transport system permease protein